MYQLIQILLDGLVLGVNRVKNTIVSKSFSTKSSESEKKFDTFFNLLIHPITSYFVIVYFIIPMCNIIAEDSICSK